MYNVNGSFFIHSVINVKYEGTNIKAELVKFVGSKWEIVLLILKYYAYTYRHNIIIYRYIIHTKINKLI